MVDGEVVAGQSFLDRLLVPKRSSQTQRPKAGLRQSVLSDLDNLLNTRNPLFDLSEDFTEVWRSVATYGLPDFGDLNASTSRDHKALVELFTDTLLRFEPRLSITHVTVTPAHGVDTAFRVRVAAHLRTAPHPEPLNIDITMSASTRRFRVSEAD